MFKLIKAWLDQPDKVLLNTVDKIEKKYDREQEEKKKSEFSDYLYRTHTLTYTINNSSKLSIMKSRLLINKHRKSIESINNNSCYGVLDAYIDYVDRS